ncbi:hypothetical protein R1flu_021837 [Riccia fluitans]|uniref:Uncharacterized protein n=1 Tax=Riccia fluitans TaxID=41844 RepID=A0ABD1ZTI1_9MARC
MALGFRWSENLSSSSLVREEEEKSSTEVGRRGISALVAVCQKAKRVRCCESSLKEGFFRLWRSTNAANAVAVLTEKLEASASESTPRLKP